MRVVDRGELDDGVGDTGSLETFAVVTSSRGGVATEGAATGTTSRVGAAGTADSAAGAGGAGSGSGTVGTGSGADAGTRAGSSAIGST